MNRNRKKAQVASAKSHQSIQKAKRQTAIVEATHASVNLDAKGNQLKEQRTGKKRAAAFEREMGERGYVLKTVLRRVVDRRAKGPKIAKTVPVQKWTRIKGHPTRSGATA